MKSFVRLTMMVALNLAALSLGALAQTTSPTIPNFFARRDYPEVLTYGIQAADTNGDGIPDLIEGGGPVETLFGNGDGTFRSGPVSLPIPGEGATFQSFLAADLNGDGITDLVLVSGGIVASLGNGDGTFETGVVYPMSDGPLRFSLIGDFNGDDIPDIAVPGGLGIWLLIGRGNGMFNSPVLAVPMQGTFDLAAADFNKDGKLDLAVTLPGTGNQGTIIVLLGNGNGSFQTPETIRTPGSPYAIAAGSLTRGGPPSIAVGTATTEVLLYFGDGKGGFSGPRATSLPAVNDDLAIADINGDGLPDLISAGVYVAYGKGLGYFSAPVSYTIEGAEEVRNFVLADLRNNGSTDILTGGYFAISVLLNEGKGLLEDGIWTSVAGGAGCGVSADFNKDGKPDLAVNTPSGISILLGTEKILAPFQTGTSIALTGAGCLATADINSDGKPDLLVPVNGTVVAYLGAGDGTFALSTTVVTPSGGYIAVGDFNHDGKLDFVTSGNLIALGNGDGTFQAPSAIMASPPDSGFSGIAVGDLDKDGWPDLVLTNEGIPYNNAFVLLNNHVGTFTQVPTTFGELTAQPILADLNGDGKLDLILGGGSGAGLFLGNGKGSFTLLQTFQGPSNSEGSNGINVVTDVNGDGIPDVLISGSDTLDIHLGEKGGTYATPFSIGTGPSPGSIIPVNLHGQPAKWGVPDLVVPDTSGGVMVLPNLTIP